MGDSVQLFTRNRLFTAYVSNKVPSFSQNKAKSLIEFPEDNYQRRVDRAQILEAVNLDLNLSQTDGMTFYSSSCMAKRCRSEICLLRARS